MPEGFLGKIAALLLNLLTSQVDLILGMRVKIRWAVSSAG